MAVDDFKVYVTNQANASTPGTSSITVDISDIDAVEFRSGGSALAVTTLGATGTAEVTSFANTSTVTSMRVRVRADMEDNIANLDAPFSAVGVYAQVTVGGVNQLRQVGIVPATAATTALVATPVGRNWDYVATLSLDAIWAVVEDTVADDADYTGSLVIFGVAEDGLVVADASAAITISNRD